MARNQDRLPGTSTRRKLGRHRREFDQFAKHARDVLGRGHRPLELDLDNARGLADQLDNLERDPDASSHTFAMVARTYHDLTRPILDRIGAETPRSPGLLRDIRDALTEAVQDSATS